MALERGYRVQCDRCGRGHWAEYYSTPYAARAEGKRTGWQRRKVGEDYKGAVRQDICPDCIEKEAQADGKPT